MGWQTYIDIDLLPLLQTGAAHAKAGQHEAAEAAYSRAHKQCMLLMKDLQGAEITEPQHCDIMAGCMDLLLARLTNAWKLHQEVEPETYSSLPIGKPQACVG